MLRFLVLMFALSSVAVPSAAAPLLVGGGSGTPTATASDDVTAGFAFTFAGAPITVTALGILDLDPRDIEAVNTLDEPHDVGLWIAGGQLLASATVDASDPLDNGFKFATLGVPVVLLPNVTYVLAANYPTGGSQTSLDWLRSDTDAAIAALFDPGFTYVQGRSGIGFGLVDPTSAASDVGYVGPNMLFERAVPEPLTLALFGVAAGAIGVRRLRRTFMCRVVRSRDR
jgi:hypothetical protein